MLGRQCVQIECQPRQAGGLRGQCCSQRRCIQREIICAQGEHGAGQCPVEDGQLFRRELAGQLLVEVVALRADFLFQLGQFPLQALDFALYGGRLAALRLTDAHDDGIDVLLQRGALLVQQLPFRNEGKAALQRLQLVGLLAQLLFFLFGQALPAGQLDVLVPQAFHLGVVLAQLPCQCLVACVVMLLPVGEGVVDQRLHAQQPAAQFQSRLVFLFQCFQQRFLGNGRTILAPFAIQVGKGTVPFGLEIDARIGQIAPEYLQQVFLDIGRGETVELQCVRQHPLEAGCITGMFQPEHAQVQLAGGLAVATAVDHVGKFAARIAEYPPLVRGQMGRQLRLGHQFATGQPVFVHIQRPRIGKILVIETHALAHAAEHHGAGFGQRDLQQDVGAVVREIETPALVGIVCAEIHHPPVDDQQILQRIDEAGLARVVGCHQRHGTIERQLGAGIAGTVEQHQTLETVLHQGASPVSVSGALLDGPNPASVVSRSSAASA